MDFTDILVLQVSSIKQVRYLNGKKDYIPRDKDCRAYKKGC